MLVGADAVPALLLKSVQHVDAGRQTNRIDRAIGISLFVVNDFEHTGATETVQRLRGRVLVVLLCIKERLAHQVLHRLRELLEVAARRSDPEQRPSFLHAQSIPVFV